MDGSETAQPSRARTWWWIAVIAIGGTAVAAAAHFLLPLFLERNDIRWLVVEGVAAICIAAVLLLLIKRAVGLTATLTLVVVLIAAFAGSFEIQWRGDMQQSVRPRFWLRTVLARAGYEFGDVVHEARAAQTALAITPASTDSPQFLGGPARLGVDSGVVGRLARDWSAQPPRELWRKSMADGWSSFAVAGHYGFTQEQSTDGAAELVTCYDLNTGELQWAHSDAGGHDWFLGGKGPRATPAFRALSATDMRLVAIGSNGLVNCLDAATGRVLWSHDLVKEMQVDTAQWGKSESPLIIDSAQHGPIVVIAAGVKPEHLGGYGPGPNPPAALVAFRLADGGEVWRGGDFSAGYCSPQLSNVGGVPQILIVHWQTVVGHDPETGKPLWSWENWRGGDPKVPQPVVIDDHRVLASSGYGVGCRMLEVKQDGTAWQVKELWKSNKLKPKFSNVVVRAGHVYGIDDGEFLACLDLADGKLKWRSPRGKNLGHGQVLLIDDLLIVTTEFGDVLLCEANQDEYRELGRFTALPKGITWNMPMLWGHKLLLRNDDEAACYELPLAK